MDQDTRPADLDALGSPDQLSDFAVTDAFEIRALLRDLMDRGTVINLNGSDGCMYGSTLWSVDGDQRRIAFTADLASPMVQRLVEAEEAVAVGYLDRIKIQFDLGGRLLLHGRQSCVLQADLPRVLYRFQRRNAYRVRTIERMAPHVMLRHPSLPDMALSLRVLDLSIGGCALFLPENVPQLAPGVTLGGAVLELEPGTQLPVRLHVHHVTAITPEARGVRLGCELVQLSPDAQRSLQRYIDQMQKRRRQMSLD